MRSASVLRRISALLLVGFAASCSKAKLGDPIPTGITVSTDANTISADVGVVKAHAQVFENAAPLLNTLVTFDLPGAVPASTSIPTDPLTGIATMTWTNFRTAGGVTLTATAGAAAATISATQPITVLPGLPGVLSLGVVSQSVDADNALITYTSSVKDNFTNSIPGATVDVSTDAPGAQIHAGTVTGL